MHIALSPDGTELVVTIPAVFRRRGSRRLILAPDVPLLDEKPAPQTKVDDVLLKAVVKAFHWQEMIDDGRYADSHDLAAGEKVDRSYASRVVRLTLLAPDIVEAILDGTQPRDLTLEKLIRGFPRLWSEQRQLYGFPQPEPDTSGEAGGRRP
jgi:hypothetical protein